MFICQKGGYTKVNPRLYANLVQEQSMILDSVMNIIKDQALEHFLIEPEWYEKTLKAEMSYARLKEWLVGSLHEQFKVKGFSI